MTKDNDRLGLPCTIPEALARFEDSDRIALICGEEQLSYREMISDARHIAHALVARGIKKGDRVVQDMCRSADYMRVYLGIIYAGAVQVALHSGWPAHQRSRVLSDCAPALVVDDEMARVLITDVKTARELVTDDKVARELGTVSPDNNILPEIFAGDPFQIIYTSGSTGAPKGVVNCHQLAICTLTDGEDTPDNRKKHRFFSEGFERVLMDCNPAFALSGGLYFRAFLNEKTLVMATEEEVQTPSSLAGCIRRTGADVLHGVSSRFLQFLDDPDFAGALSVLRLIVFVGEMADPKVLDALDRTGAQLRYVYASTESWVSMFSPPCRKGEAVLYDAPMKEMPVWLLEEGGLDEVSSDQIGEICIGGNGGKYGWYWNDPELTAKKYVEHPLYGRILRTGDFARYEKNGQLRILGRQDGMAKIHGQRVELGAIETVMETFPGIRSAAVKTQGEEPDLVLCGYYSCDPELGGRVQQAALRRYLAESLPYYMVPLFLQELPKMPLNANGKLDRRALLPMESPSAAYAPPVTEAEKLLCEAFAQVLGLDVSVGIDDSFFALGGDSIRGMAVGALLKERGFMMKMEWLFAVPTIRHLAPMLLPLEAGEKTETRTDAKTEETLWSLELSEAEWDIIDAAVGRGNVETVYPLLLEAGEMARRGDPCWLVEMLLIPGDITEGELRRRLEGSAHCHQVLRSVIAGQGTAHPLQVVLREWEIRASCVDLRKIAETDGGAESFSEKTDSDGNPVEKKNGSAKLSNGQSVISDAQARYLQGLKRLYRERSFSSTAVMFEAVLVRISEAVSVLVLAYSHLLLDGAGKIRIWKELAAGAPAVSDILQYNRSMRYLASDSYQEESRRAWSEVLEGKPELTTLTPAEVISVDGKGGGSLNLIRLFSAGEAFSKKAAQYCAKEGVTVSALTCLALGRVLMELCDAKEAVFLSMTSGRSAENAYLTGMFAASFPVCIGRGDSPASVQDQLVRATSLPAPGPDMTESVLGNSQSGLPVLLSMQTYLQAEGVRMLDLAVLPGGTSTPMETMRPLMQEDSPAAAKPVTVLVFPEGSFRIAVLCDASRFDRTRADELGRRMLAELRRVVEAG